MANLIRSSKSGSDWTANDLLAYNTQIVYQDSATFFGSPNLPHPDIKHEVLTLSDADDAHDDDVYNLLRLMQAAMTLQPNEESAVDDFAIKLFDMLHYTGRNPKRYARSRKDLSFLVCGEERLARTDVCILDRFDILLLIQEDKRHMEVAHPQPQLIAKAIAAFSVNNSRRVEQLGLAPLDSKVLPGVTLMGTMPTFYKILVTANLVHAVQLGEYPEQETIVHAHLPVLPRPELALNEGMRPLDNRRIILSCYEAFKQFL